MKRIAAIGRVIACALVTCVFMSELAAHGEDPQSLISVTGIAKVRVPADVVVIQVSIESLAKTASEARKDNHEKRLLLIEFLKSQNVEAPMVESDLLAITAIEPTRPSKGSGYSNAGDEIIGEGQASQQKSRIVGYRAHHKLTILIKDLANYESIYQGIVDKGLCRVESVKPRSSKESQESERLHKAAVRNAKERASSMVSELGANLSGIKWISNSRLSVGSQSTSRGGGMGGMGYNEPGPSEVAASSHITLEFSVDVVFYLDNQSFNSK